MADIHILTDVEHDAWVETWERAARPAAGSACNWSVRKRTLRGGLSDGVDVIDVDNGALSFSVLPTRGMGIWRGRYKGCDLGWRSPVRGPVNPAFMALSEDGGLGWLRGFDEWVVRCGLAFNGASGDDIVRHVDGKTRKDELTLHGRIANLPARYVAIEISDDDPPVLSVVGEVVESMLFLPCLRLRTRIETVAGSNALTIIDEVVNCGATEAEMELLYHCNFGPPFLEEDSRIIAPVREVAPRDAEAAQDAKAYDCCDGPVAGFAERVYWYDLAADSDGNTLTLLRNAKGDKAAALRFNKKELPWFTLWKDTAALPDGYVVGLEPGTDFPNNRSFERERGRVVTLAPGATYSVSLKVEAFDDAESVGRAEDEIAALQAGTTPTFHRQPNAKWSSDV